MRIKRKQKTIADGTTEPTVNVLVSGFAGQSQVSVNAIADAIDALPAFHLAGLDEIIYDPKWETPAAGDLLDSNCPRRSKGVFLHDKRTILVFAFDSALELQHILYHEIGHHVFDRILESGLRKKWTTQVHPVASYVTPYARRNALEDFAECYAMFVRDPKKIESIRAKYVFLRDHVFRGIACNVDKGHIDVSV